VDGTWPTGTSKWEKRAIALQVPAWDTALCIQCNKCALICPHAAIRARFYPAAELAHAPPTFQSMNYRSVDMKGAQYSLQVAPEDCTGCTLCVEICPAESKTEPGHRALHMVDMEPVREQEKANFEFFQQLPEPDRTHLKLDVKGTQFLEPLFEFSGACTGCGETPYIRLLTQLYGDRALIANATGCSSIFGGNLPTTPYTTNHDGRGPAWANSLFEDNAEFGLGMRVALDKQNEAARELLRTLGPQLGDTLIDTLLKADQSTEAGIDAQRRRVRELRAKLAAIGTPETRWLDRLADSLVRKSVWIVGGDGWAYDIGYGGLDHVIATNKDVNILVLDTEVYSNTGGQASKATPLGAAAKFATGGKTMAKKDLALLAMSYGHPYVARVAIGAKDAQTVNVFKEADSYPGVSVIIAYSHCIAHGFEMSEALQHQAWAVETGYWPLFRYDPRRAAHGESPLKLDSPAPKAELEELVEHETRFRMVEQAHPAEFHRMMIEAQRNVREKYALYEQLAKALQPHAPGGAGAPKAQG
jgi:pyruvate-ferredoxin/flavodoxin oxidoreductase